MRNTLTFFHIYSIRNTKCLFYSIICIPNYCKPRTNLNWPTPLPCRNILSCSSILSTSRRDMVDMVTTMTKSPITPYWQIDTNHPILLAHHRNITRIFHHPLSFCYHITHLDNNVTPHPSDQCPIRPMTQDQPTTHSPYRSTQQCPYPISIPIRYPSDQIRWMNIPPISHFDQLFF